MGKLNQGEAVTMEAKIVSVLEKEVMLSPEYAVFFISKKSVLNRKHITSDV